MNSQRFVTALIGFGRMGHLYAADPVMARHYKYAAHAQVLNSHPGFNWCAVVDPDPMALQQASVSWGVSHCAHSVDALGSVAQDIEVAVLATNPDARMASIRSLPNLRAVLVEKPLGSSLKDARAFLDHCSQRNILVQVNLWRRADSLYRRLANGLLLDLIGKPMAANAIYGNGLLNNGTHMIDFARMMFGDVETMQRLGASSFFEGPLPNDLNLSFALGMQSGVDVVFSPVRFSLYRENGLIVWGESGRLEILNEGLVTRCFPVRPNRAMQGEHEIAADDHDSLSSTVGFALYEMYESLALALETGDAARLCSAGSSALLTSQIVDSISGLPSDGRMRRFKSKLNGA